MSVRLLARFMSSSECRQTALNCLDPARHSDDLIAQRLKEEASLWNLIAIEIEQVERCLIEGQAPNARSA
jgi:hypothetical protein